MFIINFLKKRKREKIRNRIQKLNAKAAKYLKLSKVESQNAEKFQKLIDSHLSLTHPYSSQNYIYHQTMVELHIQEWSENLTNHTAASSEYKAMYDNCLEQIEALKSELLSLC